ncbi:uncharacterized protein LOC124283123 [Haliotis rubra]|uniref:uncharacterized protein LOC124283123 n=1 Tax=Haliotis rubra TaxID=36100 RepID=UPI001EE561B2|nr:uncharacterized protein LOC124283123 [Haliotis rubra]
MPTSSQALILIKTDSGRLSSFYKTRITPDVTLPLSRVNLTGDPAARVPYTSRPKGMVHSHSEPFTPSKPLEGVTVNGFRGVLSFDPILKAFRWQLLPDPTDRKVGVPAPCSNQTSPDLDESHVREEVVLTNLDDPPSPIPPSPGGSIDNSYRRLLNLGFPTSSFRGLNPSPSLEPWDSGMSGLDLRRAASHRPITGRGRSPEHLADRHMSAPSMDVQSRLSRDDRDPRSDKDVTPELSPSKEKAFIDNVKKAQKRKKSKLPFIRMRRELPPPAPNALCFCLKNKRSFSHEEIKTILENQLGTSITTLMFDPLYVHLGVENTDGACLWVFSLADDSLRIHLLHQGIIFEENRLRVRRYDDVLFDEHEAYRLYRSVEEEHQRLQLVPSQRRHSQKSLGSELKIQKHVAFTGSF